MRNKVFFITCVLFYTVSLNAQVQTTISGKVSNNPGFQKIYLEAAISQKVLDSAIVDNNGSFTLNSNLDKTDFYKLAFNQQYYLLLVVEPGEKIIIDTDLKNLATPKISGSKNSELVYAAFGKMNEYEMKLANIKAQIEKEKEDYLRNFVLSNLNSLSSLFFIENLSMKKHSDVYQKLDESLMKLYPDNYMVQNLHSKISKPEAITEGSMAPEIDLPSPNGKNIKLSSLKGKYVLIDFWAAWCGPCRRESPHMVEIYKKYSPKGFEIYGVSLDRSRDAWVAAISQDKLGAWVHVSDLKFWQSVAAKTYGVESIPFTVLLDKEGKIIAKGLRGEALKEKLAEIFGN